MLKDLFKKLYQSKEQERIKGFDQRCAVEYDTLFQLVFSSDSKEKEQYMNWEFILSKLSNQKISNHEYQDSPSMDITPNISKTNKTVNKTNIKS